MRGTRVKKLRSLFRELVRRGEAPAGKRHFRFFKKLYMRGVLHDIFHNL